MNGIDLTQIQKDAVEYVLPFLADRWSVDGKGITELRSWLSENDDPLPQTWTLPVVRYGELFLSDFQDVNDSLYSYVLAYAKLRSSCNEITGYRKRKIRKECKDLAYNIDMATF